MTITLNESEIIVLGIMHVTGIVIVFTKILK